MSVPSAPMANSGVIMNTYNLHLTVHILWEEYMRRVLVRCQA